MKSFESPQRAQSSSHPGKHENTASRDKTHTDRDKRNGEEDTSRADEVGPGTSYGRRDGKEDGEISEGIRSANDFGTEGSQRAVRRNGERENDIDKVDGRNNRRLQHKGFEHHRRDEDNEANQRNGSGRGPRASWQRDEETQVTQGSEINRESTRGRDWRDGDRSNRRGPDREWNRGSRVEQDPEWMVEPSLDEKKKVHTADDIEKWKASMKASKATTEAPAAEPISNNERFTVGKQPSLGDRKLDMPLVLDPTLDKFLGLWDPPQSGKDAITGQDLDDKSRPDTGRLNPPKSSRFTGFFSPKAEAPPSEPEPEPPAPPPPEMVSSSEDQEGFQRILQMLGGANPLAGNAARATKLSTVDHRPSEAFNERTPPRDHTLENSRESPPIHSPRSRRSIGLESLLGPQSPREGPIPQNRDSEFLLKLMQHKGSDLHQLMGSSQKYPVNNAPGILPFPGVAQPQAAAQHVNQGFRLSSDAYGDPSAADLRQPDKQNPNINPNKRVSVSDPYDDTVAGVSRRPSIPTIPQQYGVPPGLQRSQGFEQAPPGYAQHIQQQRQSIAVPPPGFQNPNRNPNQFPPGLIPNISGLNISNDRGVPFNMRQPGSTPGVPPPPGFLGINGPPPGFPPMGIPQDGRTSPTRMFFGGGPPRHHLDGFIDPAQFAHTGRGVLPNQYRRQE